MTDAVRYVDVRAADVPDGDDWLGPDERAVLAGLRFSRRRADWRLGRFAAKRLLRELTGAEAQVLAADDGAPEAWANGQRLPLRLSLSHRDGRALAAAGPGPLGCDLERVEPRSDSFVRDYLTSAEQTWVAGGPRELRANLVWSAKESALKALRCGLRVDTRSVEVTVGEAAVDTAAWGTLIVRLPDGTLLPGQWQRDGGWVLTLCCPDSGPIRRLR